MCCVWRVQLPAPPSDERKKVVEDVDRDRRYSIDAAIVRTMKSRKVLQHQQVRCHGCHPCSLNHSLSSSLQETCCKGCPYSARFSAE